MDCGVKNVLSLQVRLCLGAGTKYGIKDLVYGDIGVLCSLECF